MITHNVCFYAEITKKIQELSSNIPHLQVLRSWMYDKVFQNLNYVNNDNHFRPCSNEQNFLATNKIWHRNCNKYFMFTGCLILITENMIRMVCNIFYHKYHFLPQVSYSTKHNPWTSLHLYEQMLTLFNRPFEKRDVLCYSPRHPSIRL